MNLSTQGGTSSSQGLHPTYIYLLGAFWSWKLSPGVFPFQSDLLKANRGDFVEYLFNVLLKSEEALAFSPIVRVPTGTPWTVSSVPVEELLLLKEELSPSSTPACWSCFKNLL